MAAHTVSANQRVDAVLTDGDIGDAVVAPTRRHGVAITLAVAVQAGLPVAIARHGRIEQARGSEAGTEFRGAAEVRVRRQLGKIFLPIWWNQIGVLQVIGVQPFGEREAQCVDGALGEIVLHGSLCRANPGVFAGSSMRFQPRSVKYFSGKALLSEAK